MYTDIHIHIHMIAHVICHIMCYTYIHACIHTYIYTCMHACIHTCIFFGLPGGSSDAELDGWMRANDSKKRFLARDNYTRKNPLVSATMGTLRPV